MNAVIKANSLSLSELSVASPLPAFIFKRRTTVGTENAEASLLVKARNTVQRCGCGLFESKSSGVLGKEMVGVDHR